MKISAARETIYAQIEAERRAQIAARRRDDLTRSAWLALIDEHRQRAIKMKKPSDDQSDEYRHRLVTIAALCVAAIEAHDQER